MPFSNMLKLEDVGAYAKTSAYVLAIATGANTIAFGDFGYYWVADRQGRSFQRLNELFDATGQVGFKVTQRVDGKELKPAGTQADSTASAIEGLVTDFNALLAKLKAAGLMVSE